MNFLPIIQRHLTKIQWEALQAALPYKGGVPMLPGLRENLPIGSAYHELFVLKGKKTRDLSATFYLLLGWQDDDDMVSPYPYPEIFAIYASDYYREDLPSLDDLYQKGIEQLRSRAGAQAKANARLWALLAMVIVVFMWAINHLGPQPHLDGSEFFYMALHLLLCMAGAGALVGFVAFALSRWKRLLSIPKFIRANV